MKNLERPEEVVCNKEQIDRLLQDIVEVLKHQQSRLEILELTLLQQQTHKMSSFSQ